MIFKSIFQKHFLITSLLFTALIFTAFHISFELDKAERRQFINARRVPFLDFIKAYPGDLVEYVREINKNADKDTPFKLDIVNSEGKSYLDQSLVWNEQEFAHIQFPKNLYESVAVMTSSHQDRPPEPPPLFAPFRPRPPMPRPPPLLVKISSTEDKYLLVQDFPKRFLFRGPKPFNTLFALLALAILLSSGLSIYVLFSTFRKRASMAEDVISQLQHGNLKARFPIAKIDEVGKIMISFNKMADEIERVVHNLHDNEKTRISLLQELAHDLRTPVASLKNLTETLQSKSQTMSEELRQEILQMSLKEIDYFEGLVEDLLFLGQVIEPKYQKYSSDIDVQELIQKQLKIVIQKYPNVTSKINFKSTTSILGDEQLLTRMIRNGLENAFSFALNSVEIFVEGDKNLEIHILDDGPGLTPEELSNFGQKRKSRKVESKKKGRVSVGLGSVIMFAVAKIHQGSVSIQNKKPNGAHLVITLPIPQKS